MLYSFHFDIFKLSHFQIYRMNNVSLILDFLSELKEHNQKEWMDANRSFYEQAKKEFHRLVTDILEPMKEFDPSLAMLSVKDCIFRLNRDIRFSADKSPYKTWMAAVFSEGGKKSINAVYYLHLQPGDESMVAGGMYQPAGEQLRKIRQEVDYNAAELKQIVEAQSFRDHFGEIQGEKLSRAPKGYSPDHPNIEFLKLKSFLAMQKFTDQEVSSSDLKDRVIKCYRAVQPLNEFLNVAVS